MGFWDSFFEIQEDKMKRAGYDYNRDGHIDRKERAFYEEDFEKEFRRTYNLDDDDDDDDDWMFSLPDAADEADDNDYNSWSSYKASASSVNSYNKAYLDAYNKEKAEIKKKNDFRSAYELRRFNYLKEDAKRLNSYNYYLKDMTNAEIDNSPKRKKLLRKILGIMGYSYFDYLFMFKVDKARLIREIGLDPECFGIYQRLDQALKKYYYTWEDCDRLSTMERYYLVIDKPELVTQCKQSPASKA
ncbi:hypothetical protein [Lachnospira sp.]|uniref:hypothetical protein n=1 Tax=Lachnospira sp. TaxID=2049031 RepID=UPI00257E2F3C|nr:hypothetical protein [Lachnospira sp.]